MYTINDDSIYLTMASADIVKCEEVARSNAINDLPINLCLIYL
jgi:hypothetical protein